MFTLSLPLYPHPRNRLHDAVSIETLLPVLDDTHPQYSVILPAYAFEFHIIIICHASGKNLSRSFIVIFRMTESCGR